MATQCCLPDPDPRDQTQPPAVKVQSPNCWTARELPLFNFKWPKEKGSIYPDNAEIWPLVFPDPRFPVTDGPNF